MKFFTKKTFLFKLIVSLCLLFVIFNFGVSTVSDAVSYETKRSAALVGGKLLEPVVDLLLGLGDALLSVIQYAIMGTDSAVTVDTSKSVIAAIALAVVAVVIVGLAVTSMGGLLAAVASLKLIAGAVGLVKIVAGVSIFYMAYVSVSGKLLPDATLVPTYSISPEEIFRGEILLFDVNIFDPKEVKVAVYEPSEREESDAPQAEQGSQVSKGQTSKIVPDNAVIYWCEGNDTGQKEKKGTINIVNARIEDNQLEYTLEDGTVVKYKKGTEASTKIDKIKSFKYNGVTYIADTDMAAGIFKKEGTNPNSAQICPYLLKDSTGNVPINQSVSGNTLTSNEGSTSEDDSLFEEAAQHPEIMTLDEWKLVTTGKADANGNVASQEELEKYSNYKVKYYYYLKDGAEDIEENRIVTSANNSAMELKSTIAKWYYTLRNLAVVSLMIVLLYIGIRILIASVASEKAKYKQMIKDWIVAICLIFVMQYIMVFANNFVDVIVGLFSNVAGQNLHMVAVEKPDAELVNGLKRIGLGDYVANNGDLRIETNLMGKVRVLAQEQSGTALYIGYAMCFLVLVFYTVYFCLVYAKRLLWTMFLTIIAPLVAVSYPLDKIGDGKSQAFDLWLKEYIFNLVIQPFHLLIYIVFVSSAYDLAGNNVIYSLIALGFMIPAEKFLRKMFGFDKTTTAGLMGSVAGAALAMKGLQKVERFGKGKSSGGSDKVKFADNKALNDRGANSGYDTDKLLGEVAGANAIRSASNPNAQGQLNGTGNNTGNNTSNNNSIAGNNAFQQQNLNEYDDTFDAMLGGRGGSGNETGGPQLNNNGGTLGGGDSSTGSNAAPVGGQPSIRMSPVNPSTVTLPNGRKIPVSDYKAPGNGINLNSMKSGVKKGLGKAGLKLSDKKVWNEVGKDLKGAAKVGGAIVGAGLGASIGMATGDPTNIYKYGAAGGYALGTGSGGVASRLGEAATSDLKTIGNGVANAAMGEEKVENMKKQIADARFKNDKELRNKYAKALKIAAGDRETIDKAMNAAIEFRKYGITDNDLIIKAMKVDGGNEKNWADAERITAAQFAEKSKDQKSYDTLIGKLSDRVGTDKANSIGTKIRGINKKDNIL